MYNFPGLCTPQGHVAVLNLIVITGMAFDKVGISWAEHVTIASLSVVLVELGQRNGDDAGWRIAALVALLIIGAVAALIHIRSGELVALPTLAVLLVVIRDTQVPGNNNGGNER